MFDKPNCLFEFLNLFFLNGCCSSVCCCCYVDEKVPFDHIAYFRVHSRASSVYLSLSVLKILAISGTSGSSGFGSQRREQIDSNTLEIVSAGDHCDLRMSKQMEPLEFMLGW